MEMNLCISVLDDGSTNGDFDIVVEVIKSMVYGCCFCSQSWTFIAFQMHVVVIIIERSLTMSICVCVNLNVVCMFECFY